MTQIPQEVTDRTTKRLWFDHVSDHWGATAPEIWGACEAAVGVVAPVIAEWARKEVIDHACDLMQHSPAMGAPNLVQQLYADFNLQVEDDGATAG